MTVEPKTVIGERSSSVHPALVWALLMETAALIAVYYAVHKPIPAGLGEARSLWGLLRDGVNPAALADAGLNIGAAVWLVAIAIGVGSLVLSYVLTHEPTTQLERLPFASALGLGIVAVTFLVLGGIGGLRPMFAFMLLATLSVVAAIGYWQWPRNLPMSSPSPDGDARRGMLSWVTPPIFVLLALLTLTRALTPPVAWDALVYHLTEPQRYIDAGRIVGGIDVPHFYFPSLVEQLYTGVILIRGDIAAQLVHFVFALIGFLALYVFLRERHGSRTAWAGIALLASVPTLWSLAGEPYVEWALLTYVFLTFWALLNALERVPSPLRGEGQDEGDGRPHQMTVRWIWVSGCCAGFAMGVKYTAVFPVAALALVLLWAICRRRSENNAFPSLADAASWALVALAAALPWYAKTWALTGNPVYPFLLGGWNWDAWRAEWFTRASTGLILEPTRLLTAPFELSALATEGTELYDATLSPLLLAFLPLLLLLRGARVAWAGAAVLVVAVGYAGWLFGAAQSELLLQGRLLLPVVPVLVALLAVALSRSGRLTLPALRTSFLLEAVVALVLGINALGMTLSWVADPPVPYFAGAESRAAYLSRHLGAYYRAMDHINTVAPPESKVLLLWEPRSLLCRVECQPDALLYNWRDLLRRNNDDPAAIAHAVRMQGYSHVLLNGAGLRYFSTPPHVELEPSHLVAFARFEGRYLERVEGPAIEQILSTPIGSVAGIDYTLYKVRAGVQ